MKVTETPMPAIPCPLCSRVAELHGFEFSEHDGDTRIVVHYLCARGQHQIDMTIQGAPTPPRAA